jgi:putative spermidine/putrescine transport system ATP-binding protein
VIYVTHDQEEALALSDRIAVFNGGRIEQLGTGEDLYQRPASLFVADFIGESNILRGTFGRAIGSGTLRWEGTDLRVEGAALDGREVGDGSAALVVRPEQLRVEPPGASDEPGRNALEATVTEVLYLGPTRKIELALAGRQPALAREATGGDHHWRPGDRVRVSWAVTDGVLVADGSVP